jgi:hypothetical protein
MVTIMDIIDVIPHPLVIIHLLSIPQKLDPRLVPIIILNVCIMTSTIMNISEI